MTCFVWFVSRLPRNCWGQGGEQEGEATPVRAQPAENFKPVFFSGWT